MMDQTSIDIALFPIPGSVSFPFQTVPLHVFEPRYRKMIKDSVEQNRRIGIAHTVRETAPAKVPISATPEQVLKSNLESYEAHPIFSAGFPKILETLDDGRLIVEIKMDSRFQAIEEVQQIPYKIVQCQTYTDENEITDTADLHRMQLDRFLSERKGQGSEILKKFISSAEWTGQSTLEYSFAIFALIGLDPDVRQMVLEMKSADERIVFLKNLIDRNQ